MKLLDGRDGQQAISPAEECQAFDKKPIWQRSLVVAACPFANFFLAIILFACIYLAGAPQLPAVLHDHLASSVAAKLGVSEVDMVVGWQDFGSQDDSVPIFGEFKPVPSWNVLRWNLMDAITGEDGFALELQTPSGSRHVKAFNATDLPKISPENDPMMVLLVYCLRPAH